MSVLVPLCKRRILVGLRNPFVRILQELISIVLNSLHIVMWINDTQISPAGCFHIMSANGLLLNDKLLQGLMYVSKQALHSFGTIQNLAQSVMPTDFAVLLPIGPERFFNVIDSLQVAIPIVQIRKGSKKIYPWCR